MGYMGFCESCSTSIFYITRKEIFIIVSRTCLAAVNHKQARRLQHVPRRGS